MSPEQVLRDLAEDLGRFRFTSATALIDFVLQTRKRVLTLANDISRRPQEPLHALPTQVDKMLGRDRPRYGTHQIAGRLVVIEKRNR